MRRHFLAGLILALAVSAPVLADTAIGADNAWADEADGVSGGGSAQLPPYLQCVPYARQVSGVQSYGDAWTWWGQAAERYERGFRPRVGAVMAFKPHGGMRLGHVAAVSRIVNSRTVLLRHANWSPINGRRGQIENNVRAIDVSPDNDWSEVRVWFDPIQNLGGTHWPVQGFIYNRPAKRLQDGTTLARATRRDGEPRMQLASVTRLGEEARVGPASSARSSADPIGEIIASRSRRTVIAARGDSPRFD
ncbi:MAG: CHAP domain-containing protein [Novosphingobium sp.]